MRASWASCCLASLLTIVPALATEVAVHVTFQGSETSEVFTWELVADGGDPDHLLRVDPATTRSARLDLEPGRAWKLRALALGFWSEEVLVVPGASGRDNVDLTLHPISFVTGSFRLAGHDKLPKDLRIQARFSAAGDRSATAKADGLEGTMDDLEGTVDCTFQGPSREASIESESPRLSCGVPTGQFDIRIRASGYISHFFWDKAIEPGHPLDLGALRFEPGASIVGRVETADEAPLTESQIELVPTLAEQPTAAAAARASLLSMRQKADERGFFHLIGVIPGTYVLTARLDGYSPTVFENLLVLENAEAELDDPLVLERPFEVTVDIRPRTDPTGGNWHLTLVPARGGRPTGDPIFGQVTEQGPWKQGGFGAGHYLLIVTDSHGARMGMEFHDLDATRPSITLDLDFVDVEGRVTLAGEAVLGRVVFGSTSGEISIASKTDAEGYYAAVIPQQKAWDIDVTASEPRIYRRMRGVAVEPDGSGRALLDIELPATLIEGTVVNEAGDPVTATVIMTPISRPTRVPSVRTDDKGKFAISGHPFGTYHVEARATSDGLRSDPEEVILSRQAPKISRRIVVGQPHRITGVVRSSVGGIPGALIEVEFPADQPMTMAMILPRVVTGGDGGFTIDMPKSISRLELVVMAPGFVLHRASVNLPSESEVDVVLRQEGGGTLVLETNKPLGSYKMFGKKPYLLQSDGFPLHFNTLYRWSGLNGAPRGKSSLTVPLLPPDTYTACWAASEGSETGYTCNSQFLSAGDVVVLRDKNEEFADASNK